MRNCGSTDCEKILQYELGLQQEVTIRISKLSKEVSNCKEGSLIISEALENESAREVNPTLLTTTEYLEIGT